MGLIWNLRLSSSSSLFWPLGTIPPPEMPTFPARVDNDSWAEKDAEPACRDRLAAAASAAPLDVADRIISDSICWTVPEANGVANAKWRFFYNNRNMEQA